MVRIEDRAGQNPVFDDSTIAKPDRRGPMANRTDSSLAVDEVFTIRTGPNPFNLDSDEFFDVLDVVLCLFRQSSIILDLGRRFIPAGHLVVYDLGPRQLVEIGGERGDFRACLRVLVGNGNLNGGKGVEDVQLSWSATTCVSNMVCIGGTFVMFNAV